MRISHHSCFVNNPQGNLSPTAVPGVDERHERGHVGSRFRAVRFPNCIPVQSPEGGPGRTREKACIDFADANKCFADFIWAALRAKFRFVTPVVPTPDCDHDFVLHIPRMDVRSLCTDLDRRVWGSGSGVFDLRTIRQRSPMVSPHFRRHLKTVN